jgi:hypothetical protein
MILRLLLSLCMIFQTTYWFQGPVIPTRRNVFGGAAITVTLVQQYSNGTLPFSGGFPSGQTAGNYNLCSLETFASATVSTFTDDQGNTYTKNYGVFTSGSGNTSDISFYSAGPIASHAAGNAVHVSYSSAPSFNGIVCYEVHIASGAMTFDSTGSANHITASATSGSTGTGGTTRDAGSFLMGYCNPSTGPAVTPGAPWVDDGDPMVSGSNHFHQIVAATGAYSATCTDSTSEWNAAFAAYGAH